MSEEVSINNAMENGEMCTNQQKPKQESSESSSSPLIQEHMIKREDTSFDQSNSQPADSSTSSDQAFSLTDTFLPKGVIKLEPLDSLEEDASLLQVDQFTNTPSDQISTHVRVRKHGPRIRNNISPDTSVCEVCQAEFSNRQLLDSHKLCHFNTAHVCYVCDSYFFNADTLVLHVATIHKALIPPGHEKDGFFCYICLLRFVSSKSLAHHQQTHMVQDAKSFSCRVCGLTFIAARTLIAHLKSSRHAEMKVKITSIFLCIDCRSIFATRDAYAMHMMIRAQNETCKCTNEEQLPIAASSPPQLATTPSSGSTSTSPLNLSAVMHPCRICGTQFATESLLSLHLLMHSRSQSVTSDTQKSDTQNLEVNSNGRPNSAPNSDKDVGKTHGYICALCMQYFDCQDDLAMHLMTSHTGQAVSSGGSSCQQASSSLRRHSENLVAYQAAIQLVCHLCHHKFVSKDSLAMHMMQHAHSQDNASAMFGLSLSRSTPPMAALPHSESFPSAKRIKLSPGRESEDSLLSMGGKMTPSTEGSDQMNGPPTMVPPKCSECNMVFLDNYALSVHMRSPHHQEKNTPCFTCVLCKAVFCSQTSYLVHLQMSHAQAASSIMSSDGNTTLSIITTDAPLSSNCKSSASSLSEPLNLAVDHDANAAVASGHQGAPDGKINCSEKNSPFADTAGEQQQPVFCNPANGEFPGTSNTPLEGPSQIDGMDMVEYVKLNSNRLLVCKYCKIIYCDRTVYHLHMGLHNVNNPWQCNMCGKVCQDVYEFSSHVIHMGY